MSKTIQLVARISQNTTEEIRTIQKYRHKSYAFAIKTMKSI